jgi:hypothetical protein
MSVDFDRLKEIFLAAVEQPSPEEREAYLDRACGDDPPLWAQVALLLAAHAGAAGVHRPEVPGPATTPPTLGGTEAAGAEGGATGQTGGAGSEMNPGLPPTSDEATVDTAAPPSPGPATRPPLV